ncbi:MAG: metallophosphoesterase family protein [Acidobacteria bacterium]|nr:metallophosphoesterase family protein [Acidobacteriota bacterium]
MRAFAILLVYLVWGIPVFCARPVRVYVGALDEHSVTLAWGRADGTASNTIGYGAATMPATVRMAGKEHQAKGNWIRVEGLNADTEYAYEVEAGGVVVGKGVVRTWPEKSDELTFFVIGDWGTGKARQRALGKRMEEEREARAGKGQPVRFVLTTGDNIYSGGARDADWDGKFFEPFGSTLAAIPFYATLGNHDGNESEQGGDLPVYLDNFFFPGGSPARWYSFRFGGLAEFFAMDSTKNQWPGAKAAAYLEGGEQSRWLRGALRRDPLPWRIAVLHHPLFTAGPSHGAALEELRHWFGEWKKGGVSAVFAGHEHNLQFSERSEATGGMQFVVSGAGGKLRGGKVLKRMKAEHIAGWSAQPHFLVVEIYGGTMRITPVGEQGITVRGPAGDVLALPWVVVNGR